MGWPKAPESGRLDEATDEESSSSKSGRLISATGDSTNGDVDRDSDPVSFSKARRLDSSFSFSASAPRPDGSNLSLWLFSPASLDGFDSPWGEVGETGEPTDGEWRTLKELGREAAFWSLMFGKEMEFERVWECRFFFVCAGGDEGPAADLGGESALEGGRASRRLGGLEEVFEKRRGDVGDERGEDTSSCPDMDWEPSLAG